MVTQSAADNVFVQIPSYIFWKDLNFQFMGCNQLFAKIAGFKQPADIIGKTDYEMVWKDQFADVYREGDEKVLAGELFQGIKEMQLWENGQMADIIVNKGPLFDGQNQLIGIIGSYIEIVNPELYGEKETSQNNIPLSNRQAECLTHLATGLNTKRIATEMQLSIRTVEHYIELCKQKLNCHNKYQLIVKALKLKFIQERLKLIEKR